MRPLGPFFNSPLEKNFYLIPKLAPSGHVQLNISMIYLVQKNRVAYLSQGWYVELNSWLVIKRLSPT